MLTVNHQVDGRETIYSARLVEYVGPLASVAQEIDSYGPHVLVHDDEVAVILRGGRVYVMNHEGRTVATYVLEGQTDPNGSRPSDWQPAIWLQGVQ